MTAGTAIEFAVTVVILLAAVIGGIWLESRMPDPYPRNRQRIASHRLDLHGERSIHDR
jgi:hypothetical protein